MKRIFVTFLVSVILTVSLPVYVQALPTGVEVVLIPYATPVADTTMIIHENIAYIDLYMSAGSDAISYIQATSYIEKLVNGQYTKISLASGRTEFVNIVSGNTMNLSVTQQVSTGIGYYRITTQYAVHFADGHVELYTAACTTNYN